MRNPSVLNVDYQVYNPDLDVTIIVRESEIGPGDTEIIHQEKGHPDARVVLRDEDIPLLIEALQRRYQDARKDLEPTGKDPRQLYG